MFNFEVTGGTLGAFSQHERQINKNQLSLSEVVARIQAGWRFTVLPSKLVDLLVIN
jgi:hypothetical protein